MNKIVLIVGLLLCQQIVSAQGNMAVNVFSPSTYEWQNEPSQIGLKIVLDQVEKKFQVFFNYDPDIIKDKSIQGDFKPSDDLNKTLDELLKPLKLEYKDLGNKYYAIIRKEEEPSIRETGKRGLIAPESSVDFENRKIRKEDVISPLNHDQSSLFKLMERTARTITGQVVDRAGEPLIGVNIQVKGTNKGTATDFDGNFTLEDVDEKASLVFSYVGYQTQEFVLNGRTNINITMVEDSQMLDEVVVVGYGKQKRTTVTGSVSVIDGESIADVTVPNVSNSIAGRMSGVLMKANAGQPGEDSPDIYIRGISSIGNNSPLIVVDGIIRDNINQIDPASVASISVLKDASAVSPYGLAGANGVILITTKKGSSGAPVLTFSSYYGTQKPTYFPNVLDAKDYMRLQNEAFLNEQPESSNLPYPMELINDYDNLNSQDPDRYPNSRTKDFVNMAAPIQKYNLQVSGGTEKANYYAGIGYFQQDGLFDRTNYNRFNFNMNIGLKVTNTSDINLSILGSLEQTNDLDPEASSKTLFRSLFKYFPTDPLYYSNGLWGASAGASPLGILNADNYDRDDGNTFLNTLSFEQRLPFIEGLSLKASFSYDYGNNFSKGWHTPWVYWSQNVETTPYSYTKTSAGLGGHSPYTFLSEEFSRRSYFTYQGYINYNRDFNKHSVSGLLVAEARNNKFNTFYAQRNNFAVDVDELDMGSSNKTDYNNGGSSSVGSQLGFVYRLGYVYNEKYILEASGRYDGHYYFAPKNRWGYFPSFSMGWRLSREEFMKNVTSIDDLKIRGSWGRSGNLAGTAYQYLSGYNLVGNAYAFGNGSMVQGAFSDQEANPNITWEIAEKSNIGFELNLMNSLLTIEADYFSEIRKDMLISPAVTVPYEYGLSLSQENAAEMKSKGFELMVGSIYEFSNDLKIRLNGNVSYAKNKMTQVFETSATYDNENRRRTGRSFNTPFGYHSLGLFTTADDQNGDGIINSDDGYNVKQFGQLHPGDIKYEDISGPNGVPDGVIDGHDEVVIGFPNYPSLIFGFNPSFEWKGVDLSLFLQGASMVSRDIGTFQTVAFANNKSNSSYEYFDNHWTPDNENGKYPRANTSPSSNNTQITDFWMLNTSYIRLKSSSLGYTFPKNITNVMKLNNFRMYVSGQNLFTISNLKFEDPETSAYGSREAVSYPVMKSYAIGISITF